MMVERHYDEETLIGLLGKQPLGADSHLSSCSDCSEKLDGFRTITSVLSEDDVWDGAQVRRDPVPATIATLRAFADRMAAEDAAAEAILPELLAGPREEWMPRLMAHPEWRTAGVVRKLVEGMRRVVTAMPQDAVEMMTVAAEIANHLSTASYRLDTIARLRGAAWRELAYSLFYVGSFSDALQAIEKSDHHFAKCLVDEYDRARVAVVRALIERAAERFVPALEATRLSASTFERYDDVGCLASARLAEVHLLFSGSRFREAETILTDLERRLRPSGDTDIYARVLANLGFCLWKLGRVEASLRHHDAAAKLLREIGVHTESVRIRWNVASILVSAGRVDEALGRFKILKGEFDELGMTSESALVSLDIAEILLAREDFAAAEDICHAAINSFRIAGIPYTARALTALAYIHESSRLKVATPALAKHVREFIRRLPGDSQLLFAPPPPETFGLDSR